MKIGVGAQDTGYLVSASRVDRNWRQTMKPQHLTLGDSHAMPFLNISFTIQITTTLLVLNIQTCVMWDITHSNDDRVWLCFLPPFWQVVPCHSGEQTQAQFVKGWGTLDFVRIWRKMNMSVPIGASDNKSLIENIMRKKDRDKTERQQCEQRSDSCTLQFSRVKQGGRQYSNWKPTFH